MLKKIFEIVLWLIIVGLVILALYTLLVQAQKPPVKPPNPGCTPTPTRVWMDPFESPLEVGAEDQFNKTWRVYLPRFP